MSLVPYPSSPLVEKLISRKERPFVVLLLDVVAFSGVETTGRLKRGVLFGRIGGQVRFKDCLWVLRMSGVGWGV